MGTILEQGPKTQSGKESGQGDVIALVQAGTAPLEQSPQAPWGAPSPLYPLHSSSILCAKHFLTTFVQMRRELIWER